MTDPRAEAPEPEAMPPRDIAVMLRRTEDPILLRWLDEGADLAVKRLETLVDVLDRVRKLSIRATYPSDWVLHVTRDADGNVVRELGYLADSGAQRAAKPWGIEVDAPTIEREDFDADGTYTYHMQASARCKLTGEHATVEGSRWSGDRFFSRREDGPDGKTDPTDVRKACYANLEGRAVRLLSGLNAVPVDKLREAGLDVAGCVRIGYEKGAKGGDSTPTGADVRVGFGNAKGKAPGELADADLTWYVKAYTENLADPAKARFVRANTAILTALKTEQERRAQAKTHEAATGTKAPEEAPVAEPPGQSGQAPTPRGTMVSRLWQALNKGLGGDQRAVMGAIRRLTAEHLGSEKGSLTDLTDDELRKLTAIPEETLDRFCKALPEAADHR